jgi:hypothetical protein
MRNRSPANRFRHVLRNARNNSFGRTSKTRQKPPFAPNCCPLPPDVIFERNLDHNSQPLAASRLPTFFHVSQKRPPGKQFAAARKRRKPGITQMPGFFSHAALRAPGVFIGG